MLLEHCTEDLEIAATHARSCSLCRRMKAGGGKNPYLNFSEVKSKRKSVALKKKKNQGGRKKGKLKQSLRDTETQRAGGFCHPSLWGEILHHAGFCVF